MSRCHRSLSPPGISAKPPDSWPATCQRISKEKRLDTSQASLATQLHQMSCTHHKATTKCFKTKTGEQYSKLQTLSFHCTCWLLVIGDSHNGFWSSYRVCQKLSRPGSRTWRPLLSLFGEARAFEMLGGRRTWWISCIIVCHDLQKSPVISSNLTNTQKKHRGTFACPLCQALQFSFWNFCPQSCSRLQL
jgi:hypothetical protein